MIRLLHFADLHLGAESYGSFDPATGLSSRLGDFLASLDRVTQHALDSDIHLVLFAGDAYKTNDPGPTHQREFAQRIGRLARAGIPTVLLTGNHDIPHTRGRANTVEIFETLAIDNVYVCSRPDLLTIETRGGPVQVVTLPWLGRSTLLSLDEHKNKTIAEIQETIVEKAENIIASYIERLAPDTPTVFLAHGSVFGASYGSERKTTLGQDLLLPRMLCAHPAFDYAALGHIHRHQVLHDSPPVVYSGSLERIDFGEEKEEKGFVVAEVEKGHTRYTFVPSGARRFVTIEVEVQSDDPMAEVRRAVGQHEIDGAIVRLIVHLTAEQEGLIDERECRRLLKDAFYVAAVVRDVRRPGRTRIFSDGAVEELSPRELLRKYFENKKVPPKRIDVLLKHADALINDEG